MRTVTAVGSAQIRLVTDARPRLCPDARPTRASLSDAASRAPLRWVQ